MADRDERLTLVLDSSTIIALTRLGLAEELVGLAASKNITLMIPGGVLDELLGARKPETVKALRRIIACRRTAVIYVSSHAWSRLGPKALRLGVGERDVIATTLALTNTCMKAIAVLDDKRARREAGKLGVEVKGALAIIELLKKEKLISRDKALKAVLRLPILGFHIAGEILAKVAMRIVRQR